MIWLGCCWPTAWTSRPRPSGSRAAGVSHKGAWELIAQAVSAREQAERQAEEAAPEGASPVCPHCLKPVQRFDHFCPHCAGPVTAIASFDPMGQIYSAGRAYRLAATDKKPKGVVVLAMWLIFGPSFVLLLFAVVNALSQWAGTGFRYSMLYDTSGFLVPALGLGLMTGFFALYTAILWKVTAHWMRSKHQPPDDNGNEVPDDGGDKGEVLG